MASPLDFVTSQGKIITPDEYVWDLELRPETILKDDKKRFKKWAKETASRFGLTPRDLSRTKLQFIAASVLAGSFQHNPRRLEEKWSGFWQVFGSSLGNSVAWGPFIVQHQYNLWRLNRDNNTLAVLEIPAYEAPNSSLLPSQDSFLSDQESSMSEDLRGDVFLIQNLGTGDEDQEEYDEDEEEDEDSGDFFDPAQGRPMFSVQAGNAHPNSTTPSSDPSTTIVPSASGFAPQEEPSVSRTRKPLAPARLVELQRAPNVVTDRPSRIRNLGRKDERSDDEEISHDVPDTLAARESATHEDDAVRPMQSQTLTRGTFSCQITDMALLYAQGLEPLNGVRYDPLVANLVAQVLCNGWGLGREWVPIIVENKRLPKRGTLYKLGVANPKALASLIRTAKQQVLKQAAYFFTSLRWRHQDELVAIAAAGDWWTWTVVKLTDDMKKKRKDDHDSASAEPLDYEPDVSTLEYTEWAKTMRYGTLESCKEMTKLRAWLKKFVVNAENVPV